MMQSKCNLVRGLKRQIVESILFGCCNVHIGRAGLALAGGQHA